MLGSDIITAAMRLLGALPSGQTPSTSELSDGLLTLQNMLDGWSAEELLVFATRTAAVAVSATVSSYSIPGARPVKILGADLTVATLITSPLEVCGPERWAAIPVSKGAQDPQPKHLYCDYGYPTPIVLLAPIPALSGTLNLYCMVDLATVASTGATFAMPEGFARAVIYNLAVDFYPEFPRAGGLDPVVVKIAADSKAALARLNASNIAGKSTLTLPPVPASPTQGNPQQ